jgi:inosine/xanthosine triphosphatase
MNPGANRIRVASLNRNKIQAVKEVFPSFKVEGTSCKSGVREQPLSLDETIEGAIFRAKAVFENCEYSIGIEDGIAPVPNTQSGYMNFCACAIYDGKSIYLGLAPAFEYPPKFIEKVLNGGMTISQAFVPATGKPDIGYEEGIIGWLTGGRINRKDYTELAVEMAKVQIDNTVLYQK